MEKKKEERNIKSYILLGILILICIVACIGTYTSKNKKSEEKKISVKEELIKKTAQLVESTTWLSGMDTTEEFVYVLTLRDLKEKYRVDVKEFEEDAKCDLDQTYIEVKAQAGKAQYDTFLTCKNMTEKE